MNVMMWRECLLEQGVLDRLYPSLHFASEPSWQTPLEVGRTEKSLRTECLSDFVKCFSRILLQLYASLLIVLSKSFSISLSCTRSRVFKVQKLP